MGSVLAFATLFVGLGAIGGGHGSPAIWYVGLCAATVSCVLLITGTIRSAVKRTERKSLAPGIIATVASGAAWLKFFTIAEWLSGIF